MKEWAPYAREGMTLDGKLYGLPYYADLVTFIYNDRILRQALARAEFQAVEDATARFVVGVQWNAESLSESQPVQADLLAAFVGEAADWQGVEAVA